MKAPPAIQDILAIEALLANIFPMKLMGHRGARDRAPENTMRSFEALLKSKVPVVEFDIHESADGVWVVHHDDTLDRTTTSSGPLRQKTWTELSQVRTKEGDSLPQLEDVLELYTDTQMELQIELKSAGDFARLGRTIEKNIDPSQVTVISFNHKWLHEFKGHHPRFKTACLLFGLPLNPVEIAQSAKAEGVSMSVHWIDDELVKQCHEKNITVTAWNANDFETYQRIKSLDVDILGTDIPFSAQEWTK